MTRTRIAGGVAVLALAACLTACGSSGSSGSGPGENSAPGLSRAELATKADLICATATSKARPITEPATIASDATAAAAYFDLVFPISDRETKDLQALTPAADVARDWRAFVTAQVAADQLLLTLKQKADAKDPSGLAFLGKVQPAGKKIAAAATKIGAMTCAHG